MPTQNPRLTITLQPTLAAQLRRLSELTGNSQSALISELLDGSTPIFAKLITVLEAAELAKDSIKGRITEDMDAAQSRMEQQLGLLLEGFDDFARPLLDVAETVQRRRRRPGTRERHEPAAAPQGGTASRGVPAALSAAVPTPMSNRGVRLTQTATKTVARTAEGKRIPAGRKAKKQGG